MIYVVPAAAPASEPLVRLTLTEPLVLVAIGVAELLTKSVESAEHPA